MDVHIVGLGPAGSVAAISALRGGHEVYVSEKLPSAGKRTVCTGLISKQTLEFLKRYMDVERIVLQRIKKAVLHFWNGQTMEIRHKEGAYVLDRKKMDCLLAKEVEKNGGFVRYNEKIREPSQYKSKNIIGADGANSTVAEHFGFPKIEKLALAATAKIDDEIVEKQSVHLYFNGYTRGFFSWIVDMGKKQEVGCGVILPNNVYHAFEKFARNIGIRAKPEESAVIPLRARKKTGAKIGGRNVLLVGDAAGHVKAFSGGGLAYGLRIAELSAEFIDNPSGYEQEWRRRYGLAMAQFDILQTINEIFPSALIGFGVWGLKILCVERFLEGRKMDNPVGI